MRLLVVKIMNFRVISGTHIKKSVFAVIYLLHNRNITASIYTYAPIHSLKGWDTDKARLSYAVPKSSYILR